MTWDLDEETLASPAVLARAVCIRPGCRQAGGYVAHLYLSGDGHTFWQLAPHCHLPGLLPTVPVTAELLARAEAGHPRRVVVR